MQPFFGIEPAILGLIGLIAPVGEAAACSPSSLPTGDYKSTMKMIHASAAVFIGTVMSSSNHPTDDSNTYVRIKVKTIWKDKLAEQVTPNVARFTVCGGSCSKLFPGALIISSSQLGNVAALPELLTQRVHRLILMIA